jgi:hypothetical protein
MPMTGGPPARLILDLDVDADPIAGTVNDGCGREQPFSGWMALTHIIELALEAARLRTGSTLHHDYGPTLRIDL